MNAHFPISLLALLCLLAACGPSSDRVRIEGDYRNISSSEFYIYDESGQSGPPDTITIREGQFTFERPLSKPCVLTLLYPNFSELRLIAEPGKTITVKGDANQLMKTEIGGTEENEALTQFRLENSTRPAGDQLLAASQYIRSHPDRLSAEALFLQYFARAEQFDRRTIELLDAMRRARPDAAYLTELRRRLEPMSRTAAGAALPDFTAIDIDGDTVRASQYGKRPLVVLFWSSWNARSRAYARALHRCRKTYGDRFDVLTVSFDYSAHTSRRRAATDSLPGTLVCDGRSFDSPLTARLGVRYVPGLLLIDKNRRIVSRDLSADEIYNALGKLVTP